jgi:hypothetical protein
VGQTGGGAAGEPTGAGVGLPVTTHLLLTQDVPLGQLPQFRTTPVQGEVVLVVKLPH